MVDFAAASLQYRKNELLYTHAASRRWQSHGLFSYARYYGFGELLKLRAFSRRTLPLAKPLPLKTEGLVGYRLIY